MLVPPRFGRPLFVAILTVVSFLLVHPSAPALYRSLRGVAAPTLQDSSGHFAHTVCYSVLSLLAVALVHGHGIRLRHLGAFLIAHGVTAELTQLAIPTRTFDPGDMACNVGAVSVTLVTCAVTVRAVARLSPTGLGRFASTVHPL